jgi:hypothetical protein
LAQCIYAHLANPNKFNQGDSGLLAQMYLPLSKSGQIVTEAGIVGVAIDFGRHFQKQETGRVVAVSAPGTIGARTQVAGEAEIQGGAD